MQAQRSSVLRYSAPFFAVRVLRLLADARMAISEQQSTGIADLRPDQPEVARGVEQAGIPAFPCRQEFLDLFAQVHRSNVYDRAHGDNDSSLERELRNAAG